MNCCFFINGGWAVLGTLDIDILIDSFKKLELLELLSSVPRTSISGVSGYIVVLVSMNQ